MDEQHLKMIEDQRREQLRKYEQQLKIIEDQRSERKAKMRSIRQVIEDQLRIIEDQRSERNAEMDTLTNCQGLVSEDNNRMANLPDAHYLSSRFESAASIDSEESINSEESVDTSLTDSEEDEDDSTGFVDAIEVQDMAGINWEEADDIDSGEKENAPDGAENYADSPIATNADQVADSILSSPPKYILRKRGETNRTTFVASLIRRIFPRNKKKENL